MTTTEASPVIGGSGDGANSKAEGSVAARTRRPRGEKIVPSPSPIIERPDPESFGRASESNLASPLIDETAEILAPTSTETAPPATQSRGVANKGDTSDNQVVLNKIAVAASNLGTRIAEMAGVVDEVSASLLGQIDQVNALSGIVNGLSQRNTQVALGAEDAQNATQILSEKIGTTRDEVNEAIAEIKSLIEWVGTTAQELQDLGVVAGGIGEVTNVISRIAQQTHILALNARIEAMRSGEAGSSFAVIANSIRQLADQTIKAAGESADTAKELKNRIGALCDDALVAKAMAERAEVATSSMGDAISDVEISLAGTDEGMRSIARNAIESAAEVKQFADSLSELSEEVSDSGLLLADTKDLTLQVSELAKTLVNQTVRSGVKTVDYIFTDIVINAALEVGSLFERSIRDGLISRRNLFDQDYVLIPDTDPEKYNTKFVDFTDVVLPAIQERILASDRRIVFCAAIDSSGYIGTHNKVYSEPPTGDPIWDNLHSRNRRIFDDPVAQNGAKSTDEFLVQVYRRDLGAGKYVVMKDVSAPIYVDGKHWGAFRLGYRG
ncbi:MAG: methyl-accepting chemotaxis protein [Actinomycetota bacterium]|nr:methyl-accepting chemotaxis protein [Actinomycetota bacterium]